MEQISNLIRKLLSPIDLPESVRDKLISAYIVLFFKAQLENLFIFKSADKNLLAALESFFAKEFSSLNQEQKEKLDALVEEEQVQILGDIVRNFKDGLPAEQKQRIEEQLSKLPNETDISST